MKFQALLPIFLFVFLVFDTAQTQAEQPPNIVFIMADDLGWKDVGFMGAEFFETPHLDKFAKEGMIFTAAYSGGPNCAPTRACLMSGTYSPRHKIYTPGGKAKGNPKYMRLLVPAKGRKDKTLNKKADGLFPITNDLDPNFVCIPEILGPAGYTSARIGKWHLGKDTQGFDISTANGKGGPEGNFYSDVNVAESLTDRAVQFIDDNKNKPFFLYLTHWDVHTPIKARKDVVEKYKEKLKSLSKKQQKRFNPTYTAMIEAVDTSVGRVVSKIDELGLSEKTLIVFTSDNGGLNHYAQLEPLRGEKGSLFEAGVRVPTFMRWPGKIEANTTCKTPITSVDYLPTFAKLANAKTPTFQPTDGTDISPLMHGETIDSRDIFWHYPLYLKGRGLTIDIPSGEKYSWRGFPATALRNKKWKAIHFFETNHVALYDMETDEAETTDVSKKYPRVTKQLTQTIQNWQRETNAPVPSEPNPKCVLE